MATESWVLGGVILTSGTFTLMSLEADPPRARMDWIAAADSEAAALFRRPLHENRTFTMKLRVTPQASMDTALDKVGLLVDKLQAASATPAGVALVWTPAGSTRARTFTVLAGQITGLPIALSGDGYSWLLSSPIVTIELTCHPYWLGTETLTSTASSSTPFVTLEIPSVTGDVPALGRLIITDTATQSRRHVEWGLEGPLTYNNATSLLVDSDDMVTTGFAGAQVVAGGVYDPNATGNNAIQATLYAGQTVAVCGTGNLSHIGVFRVKGRVYSTSSLNTFRLSWRAGDGPMNTNAWVSTPGDADWFEVDLGTITVPAAVIGSQRWTGQIEVFGGPAVTGPGFAFVDYLTLIPVSDGYGKARASYSYQPGVVVGYDAFVSTTAGNALNARVAPIGGTWATSGDATDLVFDDNFDLSAGGDAVESIIRSTSAVETTGRFAILGATSYTDVQIDARARIGTNSAGTSNFRQALVARWTDASNHLRLMVPGPSGGNTRIETVIAGAVVSLASSSWTRAQSTSYRLRMVAFASGRVIAQVMSDSGAVLVQLDGNSSALATGGTLQTGKPGLMDMTIAAVGALGRRFTAFAVSTPTAEPIAIYSGKNMQVRYDDVLRQDSAGTYSGRPQSYRGGRFLVPVGTSRVLVKARRNDIETVTDANFTDATQIQVGWTPRGLAVPRA
jgi:hypothetical protein